MTSKFVLFVLSIFFFSLCSLASNDTSPGKRKISNKLYSITIPSDWEPTQGMKGDGSVPLERNGGPFHLYNLGWNEKTAKFSEGTMGVYIVSYQRLDKKPLSMKDIEDMHMADNQPPLARSARKINLKSKLGQRRYMICKEERILNGSYHKCRQCCLIQKNKDVVHYVFIALGEDVYQKSDSQKIINEILDSFVINSK